MPRLSQSDQHRLWAPTLLALWLAARALGLSQDREQFKLEPVVEKEAEFYG